MTWFDDFPELTRAEPVVVYARTGSDNYGQPLYAATGVTYARSLRTLRPTRVRSDTGEEVIAAGDVFLAPVPAVKATDKLVFFDGAIGKVITAPLWSDESAAPEAALQQVFFN